MSLIKYLIACTFLTFVFSNAIVTQVAAQETTKSISLDEAISAALTNNKDVHLASLDENIATARFKQTEAIFLPQVNLSYTAMSTNNPLNAFGFKLQQRTISPNDFNPALLNHPSGTTDFMAKLEVQQPLINMDMLYQRKGAEKQTEVYQYKTRRTKEYLAFEVQKAYLQLQLAYDAERVLAEALQTATSVYTYTDNHFKQGLIQKSDVLNAQVRVTTIESQRAAAKSNIRNASDYLGLLMGEKTGVIYQTIEASANDQPDNNASRGVAVSRADFMAMQKAIDASDLMIKSSRMSYLPKLNAFGNYQYNDSHLVGFNANAYLVGVQLSWDIFKGNKTKNTITVQKLERDKLAEQLAQQKDQSQLELNKAYRDLSDAQFEISQEKAAIEQASESLRILKNRFQQGLVNTTDVLMAETQRSQQKFLLARAQFTLNLTRYYIQFLSSSTNK
jgi:outer membrane protein TolC